MLTINLNELKEEKKTSISLCFFDVSIRLKKEEEEILKKKKNTSEFRTYK